jgi:hypothetical protein
MPKELNMFRSILVLGMASVMGACVTEVEMPLDVDQDGLLDIEEDAIGTDPFVADSDGDGHLDGAESWEGTDPLDFEDHPYFGGYEIDGNCRDMMQPEGNAIGQVTDKIIGPDQFGEVVDSYDFCGKYILLINALDT